MCPFAPPEHRPLHVSQDAERRRAYDNERASAAVRGYDWTWRKLRRWFLLRNPLCVMCLEEGHIVKATVPDHVVPVRKAPDRRLDETNLRALCKHHHDQHTQRTTRHGRTYR